ncbi:MAG TPA: hypothetical protein VFK89_07455 [Actinomycetota bacterium]|nr:hypothetical protein [Actinomycetota bacterium]
MRRGAFFPGSRVRMGLFAALPLAAAIGAGAYLIPCRVTTCEGHALAGGAGHFETTLRPGAEVIWAPGSIENTSDSPVTLYSVDVDTAPGFHAAAEVKKVELIPGTFGTGLFGTYPPLDASATDPCDTVTLRRPEGLRLAPGHDQSVALWLKIADDSNPAGVTRTAKIQGIKYVYEQSGRRYETYDRVRLTVTVDDLAQPRPLSLVESSCDNVIRLPA